VAVAVREMPPTAQGAEEARLADGCHAGRGQEREAHRAKQEDAHEGQREAKARGDRCDGGRRTEVAAAQRGLLRLVLRLHGRRVGDAP
jgi:hypothetical protein